MPAGLRIALAFLTILPVRIPAAAGEDELRRSSRFFPLVGWLLGAALFWLARGMAAVGMPALAGAVLLVTVAAWLTRGLHLDGVADLLDGLGGGRSPEQRLAIMKDSAIGAFGVLGLVLVLLLKVSCLAVLLADPAGPPGLLIAAPMVASRWAMVLLACGGRYPRRQGTGHVFVGRVRGGEVGLSGLLLAPLFAAGWPVFVATLASLLPALWLRWQANRSLGGVTGDVLGAGCELGEAAGWLAAALALVQLG